LGFVALQWRDVKMGRRAQEFTTLIKGLVYLAIVAGCFLLGGGHRQAAAAANAAAPTSIAPVYSMALAVMLALQAVIYTYDGWNGPIYFSEEVKDPGREIPRAMFGGVFSIMAIYISFNLALVYVLPLRSIAGDDFAIGKVANMILGPRGEMLILGLMIAALLSAANAYPLMATRVLFAMSCDGLVSRRATAVNAGGTPTTALVVSTAASIAFITVKEFSALIEMMAYFFVANYAMSFLSLFILRRREPDAPRPYRAWGYPWTTGLALLGAVAFLVGSIVADITNTQAERHYSIYALALLALSYPAFRLMRRKDYKGSGQ
ncbi:MAG TPA: APC family permease, partial [Candidatus Acidoferrales bacterium]|nr:APC family permease [Candidatus Acidoferrales bacterium]